MDINELKAFLAVAETESFSLAGEQLHLTQPAVSKRVASLEAELNTRLFDRISRNISLTEAGRQLLPRAQQMLYELEDIRRSISNLTGEIGGILTMATSHHIGLRRLPPALKHYSRHYPQVQLDIRFMDSETACSAVQHGSLELAIVTLPIEPLPNLTTQAIWHDPLLFVISREHPLANRAKVSLKDLVNYPAVLVAQGTYTRRILEQALEPLGLTLQIGMSTNYFETLKMMVSIGLGWSLLPESMTDDPDLQVLKISELQLSRTLGAVTHTNRSLSNAARAMVQACLSVKG
ncbi:MAG: LysR family transcriptional regulator [Sedimenticola sp.]|uniref:LysR family transcriptional regulator n=1 Tax=Sedimenticola thiotaurini TaxID=1543721 RepID=A0A558DGT2_9GAMM|nr:LysR family transcriptional regulator [Sedimenticola sp.]MCW8947135.1 LysR family transcriptional regulator [Sedimenticola sp.]MCW9021586.1 LysR family transcriptional regulator [Sedimenticola sp.]MDF1528863.1 LysR family transcriptional regulator [Sedimenticola sp.]TVT60093.1 MAG: LysR family transcriptional regulator [Sedimenticola thiotaurini]